MQIAGVELTHPDKIFYPEGNFTKQDVAEYYERAAEYLLPFLIGRPATLVRSPAGVNKGVFYQRHAGEYFPDYIERVKIHGKEETEIYITIDELNDLIYLVNQGVLEFHAWGSTCKHEDNPDQLIWDLDPGSAGEWKYVVQGALMIKEKLERLGLKPFAKLSGSKGIHVVLPIKPAHSWEEGKAFTLLIAEQIVADDPDHFTVSLPKEDRVGKVFIDYLRNSKGATAVSPFSLRARQVAAAAAPIDWKEVELSMQPNHYTLDKLDKPTLKKLAAHWKDFWEVSQSLPKATS
jgi:bifunctional non-homologous end joining protein LigD